MNWFLYVLSMIHTVLLVFGYVLILYKHVLILNLLHKRFVIQHLLIFG